MEVKFDLRNVVIGVILAIAGFAGGFWIEKTSLTDGCVNRVQQVGGNALASNFICKGIEPNIQYHE